MKIAITAQGENLDSQVDPRFGRAAKFIIYDTETKNFTIIDNVQNMNAAQGAGIQAAQNVIDTGSEAVITGNCGPKAFSALTAGNIAVYPGASGTIQQSIEDFTGGKLKVADSANVEGHWT